MAPSTPTTQSSAALSSAESLSNNPDLAEIGHYVVTAHPPSSVYTSVKCSFLSPSSSSSSNNTNNDEEGTDVVIAKANLLEVRRYQPPSSTGSSSSSNNEGASSNNLGASSSNNNDNDVFPLLLTLPINGRIQSILPMRFPNDTKDCLFILTEKGMYTLISYDETFQQSSSSSKNSDGVVVTGEHYPIKTHATGCYKSTTSKGGIGMGGQDAECGPLVTLDPLLRCIAIHSYVGYVTIVPIHKGYSSDNDWKLVPWRRNAVVTAEGGGGDATVGSAASATKPRGLSTGPFGNPYHLRIEEQCVLSMAFLQQPSNIIPQLAILHQNSRGYQHISSHGVDLSSKKLILNAHCTIGNNSYNKNVVYSGGSDKKPSSSTAASSVVMPSPNEQLWVKGVEGGSGCLISVPPPAPPSSGGGGDFSSSSKSVKHLGGVILLGQQSISYHCGGSGSGSSSASVPCPTGGALLLSNCRVLESDDDNNNSSSLKGEEEGGSIVRYLLGDEHGRVHLLSLIRSSTTNTKLLLDTLGTASTSSSIVYLGRGHVFVGSSFGNSQLLKILDTPVEIGPTANSGGLLQDKSASSCKDASSSNNPLVDTTYIEILEEYDNLGPIVDFDLRPCSDDNELNSSSKEEVEGGGGSSTEYQQSLVVTCSGVGKDGTVRLVRNGVGMREHASVDMEGIKGMWSLRRRFGEVDDSFLVQSFVRETRILGVQSVKDVEGDDMEETSQMEEDDDEEEGGALAEVTIDGFNSSKSTLFAGNMLVNKKFDLLLQVVEDGVRLVDSETLTLITQWSPFSANDEGSDDDEDAPMGFITVASANESGQIIVALRGGALVYLLVEGGEGSSTPTIRRVRKVTLDREISCIDLNPFGSSPTKGNDDGMDVDKDQTTLDTRKSQLVAVGLWDDFSVRLLNLGDDPSSVLEQVLHINLGRGSSNEASSQLAANDNADSDDQLGDSGQHMMARSLCFVTMDSQSTGSNSSNKNIMSSSSSAVAGNDVDMLFVGLGDGKLISFVVKQPGSSSANWSIHSRKEVSLGTQGVHLIPFQHGPSKSSGSCVLATGDRPTVVYLTGGNSGSNSSNPKLNYSTISLTVDDDDDDDEEGHASHKNISVNVAAPFRSSLLFSSANDHSSSLCVADESCLRLGVIDDIQKLHVTSYKLGMTPRRIAYHEAGRVYCVGCIGNIDFGGGEANQNNCVRFFDDSTFEELNCITLEPFEMILSIESVSLSINSPPSSSKSNDDSTQLEYRPYIVMGTAYGYPDEDEPSQGRVLVIECNSGNSGNLKSDEDDEDQLLRQVSQVADLPLNGGIYSIAPFYDGNILVTCGSNTILCQLSVTGKPGELMLNHIGSGHHGHLISLSVKSLVSSDKSLQKRHEKKQLAIVGDLMRSVALVEYFPKHQVIEELARDFNSNYVTDIAMLTNNTYMASEDMNNLCVLQYNPNATTEQARVRLDTVGQYHIGQNVNKMMGGSLVMPSNSSSGSIGSRTATGNGSPDKSSSIESSRKIDITIGSQTLYGTVDGTIGSVLGLGGKTFAFLSALQRAMDAIVRPVGDLSHAHYRAWRQGQKTHGSCGFVDGDWIETFLDLNRPTMERVVKEMNINGKWNIRDDGKGFGARDESQQNLMDTDEGPGSSASSGTFALSVEDVLVAVEELSMLH